MTQNKIDRIKNKIQQNSAAMDKIKNEITVATKITNSKIKKEMHKLNVFNRIKAKKLVKLIDIADKLNDKLVAAVKNNV